MLLFTIYIVKLRSVTLY